MPRVTPPERDARYPDFPTIIHALAYAAEHRGQAPALACLDREITYAQYAQASLRWRADLTRAALPASASLI